MRKFLIQAGRKVSANSPIRSGGMRVAISEADKRRWECVDDDMANVLRQKTGEERLAIADGLWRSARKLVIESIRKAHPDWTEEMVDRETARRMSHGAL